MAKLNVGILGAGALGSLVGAYLSQNHQVILYGRPANVEAIEQSGLQIEGVNGSATYPVRAVSSLSDLSSEDFDLIILGVKTYGTKQILKELAEHRIKFKYIASLQNGLKDEILISNFGIGSVLGCVVNEAVKIIAPSKIYYSNRGASYFGTFSGENNLEKVQMAETIASSLKEKGINSGVSQDMQYLTWYKFMTIVPAFGVNGAFNSGPADTFTNPYSLDIYLRSFEEMERVAKAEKIPLEPSPLLNKAYLLTSREERRDSISNLGEKLRLLDDPPVPSLVLDIRAGKSTTEADEIIGKMLSLAENHGLSAEITNLCYLMIKSREWENKRKEDYNQEHA